MHLGLGGCPGDIQWKKSAPSLSENIPMFEHCTHFFNITEEINVAT